MRPTSGNTLLKLITAGCGVYLITGCGYVLSLLLEAGLVPSLSLITAANIAWLWYFLKNPQPQTAPETDLRLFIVAGIVTLAACTVVKAHGAYDAWLHWNSLARYMSRPEYFRMLHRPGSLWHADYPPGLPAPIGMIWRVVKSGPETVPRVISFLFYLCIPLLLCAESTRQSGPKHLWLGILALFTINVECLSQGLNQYADVPLALFLLLSFMHWNKHIDSSGTSWFFTLGVLLGGCLLMKNEGVVVVPAFLIAHLRGWAKWRPALLLLAGLAVPLAVLVLYKAYIPTPNDLVAGLKGSLSERLRDPERYRIIGYYLLRFGLGRFPLFILFFGWVVWKSRRNGWSLSAGGLCLLLCAAGYFAVYMTTDIGLSWLVPTSLNRLVMQLLPAAVYLGIGRLHRAIGNDRFQPPQAG
jgi:hypothetical protein